MRLSRRVSYPLELVHRAIAEVADYPSFVPGVTAVRIIPHDNGTFMADLDVRIWGKPHTYRSHVTVEPLCVRAKAHTFLGNIDVAWHLRQDGDATHVDFQLTTSIPMFDRLMPREWPMRIMNAFIERCSGLA